MTTCREGFELYLYNQAKYNVRSNIHIFKSILFLKGTFLIFTQENIHICTQKHIVQTKYLFKIIHSQVQNNLYGLVPYVHLTTLLCYLSSK